MDSDKMRNENIAVTQKKLFLSYRYELYEKFCFCLAAQNGHAVTYKELYEAVWHSEYLFDDGSIMAHIHRIRHKIEKICVVEICRIWYYFFSGYKLF